MPLKLALGVRGTVAGPRLGAQEGGEGGYLPMHPHPWGRGGGGECARQGAEGGGRGLWSTATWQIKVEAPLQSCWAATQAGALLTSSCLQSPMRCSCVAWVQGGVLSKYAISAVRASIQAALHRLLAKR